MPIRKANKTIKVTEQIHDWINKNKNGLPRGQFISEVLKKIEVVWNYDEDKFKVKIKKG